MQHDLVEVQKNVELTFGKENINQRLMDEYREATDQIQDKGAECIQAWLNEWEDWHSSIQQRTEPYRDYSTDQLKKLVLKIFCVTIKFKQITTFSNVVGICSGMMEGINKLEKVKNSADILSVLHNACFYTISKEEKYGQLMLVSDYVLSDNLQGYIDQCKFLPPMVVKPNIVKDNNETGLLVVKKHVMCGKKDGKHSNDVCLDNLNKLNQIPLTLNLEFLTKYSEVPTYKDNENDPQQKKAEKYEDWERFVKDSYKVYRDLVNLGNEYYITHKCDSRGRTYAQGYHVNPQGNAFRKAIIDFAEQEKVTGI